MCTDDRNDRPHPNSYWVRPGRLAAGEYPGEIDPDDAAAKVRNLLESGINHFIDLTETIDGLEPYVQIAVEEGRRLGSTIGRERYPIKDLCVPRSPDQMSEILDAIDDSLSEGKTVYVHCWGGVGRTGTVVGCWLVRHGLTGEEALAQIAEWWKGMEKSWRVPCSPETIEQHEYVRGWEESSRKETDT